MKQTLFFVALLICLSNCKTAGLQGESIFYQEEKDVNLYAFVGQKISVEVLERDTSATETFVGFNGDTVVQKVLYFDQGFTAKYKIVRPVFNDLQQDTVTFLAFDHYGRPKFENYEYVMLYLSRYEKDGKLYHQKYQYDPVKRNENGTWRGLNGESIAELFEKKKHDVFKINGVF